MHSHPATIYPNTTKHPVGVRLTAFSTDETGWDPPECVCSSAETYLDLPAKPSRQIAVPFLWRSWCGGILVGADRFGLPYGQHALPDCVYATSWGLSTSDRRPGWAGSPLRTCWYQWPLWG